MPFAVSRSDPLSWSGTGRGLSLADCAKSCMTPRQPPPKSTGRERFGERFLQRVLGQAESDAASCYDVLASLTEFTAQSIALNYQLHLPSLPKEIILCGGGEANPFLVQRLQMAIASLSDKVRIRSCKEWGWPRECIEPAAFALLAHARLMGRPGNIPSTTGARRASQLGQITEPPENI